MAGRNATAEPAAGCTCTAEARAELAALEQRIDDLRAFEREYRTRLTHHVNGQLALLDEPVMPDD